ncbi:tRNA lysidine(34) synthetase TilS [Camelimonas lactis]|uniref:tRNA(Ile)-lysidine synthase n=1 Tax=Camelimonas lactis TaxID=659006 RepID=A0A4V2RX84_9HYPH|nr:tRNA lysidine(34) synthetase TilS [Camelimonas lactis]TCO12460.1 tRNA(Ile)-lysidine synthase [Camelimonas lactis]
MRRAGPSEEAGSPQEEEIRRQAAGPDGRRVSDDAPVTAGEADFLFSGLATAAGLLLAVSGGPDSLALLYLAARWRAEGLARGEQRPPLAVAVVDHRLRPEAAGEARMVMARARAVGAPGEILIWEGDKPVSGVQEAARTARYALLLAEARRRGASHVLTAHHADDLAETVLMRLCAGSGVAGLAGIAPLAQREGLWLARPLLSLPKSRLVAVCAAAGWDWAVDPGNRDPRKGRGRLRRLAGELAALGLSRERLLRLAARAARADAALEHMVDRALADAGALGSAGGFSVDMRRLGEQPAEIAVRGLGRLMSGARGAGDAPLRLERLERATERLVAAAGAGRPETLTLGGLALRLDRHGVCRGAAEPPRKQRAGA